MSHEEIRAKQHKFVREELVWGTFGKNPTSYDYYRVQWVSVKDLSNNHIDAILHTQFQLPDWYRSTLHEEIIYRIFNDIYVKDVERYYES